MGLLLVQKVTKCAFGGENLDELFITPAQPDASEGSANQLQAGVTFSGSNWAMRGWRCQDMVAETQPMGEEDEARR